MPIDPTMTLQPHEISAVATAGFGVYGSLVWLVGLIARRAKVPTAEAARNLVHCALTKVGRNGRGRHRWEALRNLQPYIRADCRHLRQPSRHDR